jgi:GntR family transcriptional regulator
MPSTEQIELLDLPGGTPGVAITRTALTAEDRCVEVTEIVLDSDAYELEYRCDLG